MRRNQSLLHISLLNISWYQNRLMDIYLIQWVFITIPLFMWLHRLFQIWPRGCSFRRGPVPLEHAPSFSEHFLPFWHYQTLQPQPWKQPFLHGAWLPLLEGRIRNQGWLVDVLTAAGVSSPPGPLVDRMGISPTSFLRGTCAHAHTHPPSVFASTLKASSY